MPYKFERLDVWMRSLDYVDRCYRIAETLPRSEEFNLKSQLVRAATSISLNIAEGSTGQTDVENSRFIGMALRSLIETVACRRLIARRGYTVALGDIASAEEEAETLFAKLQALRKALDPGQHWIREEDPI